MTVLQGVECTSVQAGSITEFVGPAGVGKTQCCLSLVVQATLPLQYGGLDGGVIYVDTENTFSPSRLTEIAEKRWPDLFQTPESLQHLLERICVFTVSSGEAMLNTLESIEEKLIATSAKLVSIMDASCHSTPPHSLPPPPHPPPSPTVFLTLSLVWFGV
jgi:RAD51-like protein 1